MFGGATVHSIPNGVNLVKIVCENCTADVGGGGLEHCTHIAPSTDDRAHVLSLLSNWGFLKACMFYNGKEGLIRRGCEFRSFAWTENMGSAVSSAGGWGGV